MEHRARQMVWLTPPVDAASSVDGSNTSSSFSTPLSIAIDPSGNLFLTEQFGYKIRKITQAGDVTTIAGSGSAGSADGKGTDASFNFPCGITLDAKGNIYITDSNNGRIRIITPGGWVSTLAGNGNNASVDGIGNFASFSNPLGITTDKNGVMYVLDNTTNEVRKIIVQ